MHQKLYSYEVTQKNTKVQVNAMLQKGTILAKYFHLTDLVNTGIQQQLVGVRYIESDCTEKLFRSCTQAILRSNGYG